MHAPFRRHHPPPPPRLICQDHRSYGAIEFSSPRRRALNIHTVGRNRVSSLPRARSLPTHPSRVVCVTLYRSHAGLERENERGKERFFPSAEFKLRVHDRSRLHRSKSNIRRRKKLHRIDDVLSAVK